MSEKVSGCYMLQLHALCDHHRSARALRLMFAAGSNTYLFLCGELIAAG